MVRLFWARSPSGGSPVDQRPYIGSVNPSFPVLKVTEPVSHEVMGVPWQCRKDICAGGLAGCDYGGFLFLKHMELQCEIQGRAVMES